MSLRCCWFLDFLAGGSSTSPRSSRCCSATGASEHHRVSPARSVRAARTLDCLCRSLGFFRFSSHRARCCWGGRALREAGNGGSSARKLLVTEDEEVRSLDLRFWREPSGQEGCIARRENQADGSAPARASPSLSTPSTIACPEARCGDDLLPAAPSPIDDVLARPPVADATVEEKGLLHPRRVAMNSRANRSPIPVLASANCPWRIERGAHRGRHR